MAEYIEREAALEWLMMCHRDTSALTIGESMTAGMANSVLAAAEAIIQSIPTADVKPVVRGEWKPSAMITSSTGGVWRTHGVACSVCNSFYLEKTNYCPNCGADMRGEDNG